MVKKISIIISAILIAIIIGFSCKKTTYEEKTPPKKEGVKYYRIVQRDVDGTVLYSKTIQVKF